MPEDPTDANAKRATAAPFSLTRNPFSFGAPEAQASNPFSLAAAPPALGVSSNNEAWQSSAAPVETPAASPAADLCLDVKAAMFGRAEHLSLIHI